MTPGARTRTPSSPQPRSTGISPFLGNPPQHDRLLTQFYRRSSRRRGVGRAGVPADRSFPAAALSQAGQAAYGAPLSCLHTGVSCKSHTNSKAGTAPPSRVGGHGHTPGHLLPCSSVGPGARAPLRAPQPSGPPPSDCEGRARAGRVGCGAGRARGGAGRGGRGGPGASRREEVPAPGFGEVLPRRLRTAPPRPLPDCRAGPWSARAGGGASGSGARLNTGPEEADRPPSMSSHDAAPPAAPSRNPCCLCWCCCCSCSWNQERRRAWQASRESKLQPLPSCEVCATPSPEEVQSWAQSFDKLMHSPAGRSVFRAFLRTEYSEENMLFWLACEELKAEANQHVVDEKARLIYEDYVSILSPKEVSLDSRVREGINKKMQEPSAHTFDDAQLQIYTLMHRDSYPRFLSSPTYRALLLQGPSQSSSEA
nr:regulator of G-protein signaling 19 isoform X1 [Macaca fascicularis]